MVFVFLIVSLLGAGWFVYAVNGFTSLRALWMVPAAFAVLFVGLVVLFALIVVVSVLLVDQRKERNRQSGYYHHLMILAAQLSMQLGSVSIHTTGLNRVPQGQRFLLVSNHRSVIDPLVFYTTMPHSNLAFVAKKEAFSYPLVSQFMHMMLCLSLDRENDRSALKTILKAIEYIKEDIASIAIFPEGGVNKTDASLLPLKSGAFKIAQKTGVPIVICAITNTRSVLKNLFRRHTDIYLDVLDVLTGDQLAGCSTIDISSRVYSIMEDGILRRTSVINA